MERSVNHSSPSETGPVLRVDEVDVVREGRALLSGVSLTVQRGEHWTVLGPNGAGKSTLLRLLGAQWHPTRGTVEVLGRRLGRVDMRELRSYLGHVDPRHPLGSPLTLREVVLTGLTNSVELLPRWTPTPEQERHADELIDLFGVGHRAQERWPVLSQGERGRALVARALMPRPRLLLLDEPTTGLDMAAREQLIDSIEVLAQHHPDLATVLVTHHLEEIPGVASHALLLRQGNCVAAGPIDEVVTSAAVSHSFDHPLTVQRSSGRWSVRSDARRAPMAV
jgi:iron complex transport system ATP-binding protein